MPATERYQVNLFGIIVLIASIIILVFLIIAAVYYMNLMNLKPPTQGEATFLFWTSIILGIIFLAIAIYSLWNILTYKSIIYEEEKPLPKITPTPTPTPTPTVVKPPAPNVVTPSPVLISNIPKTTPPSQVSVSLSDVSVTPEQRSALTGELISLGTAVGEA